MAALMQFEWSAADAQQQRCHLLAMRNAYGRVVTVMLVWSDGL
jgi:hypothetical protein